MLHVKQKAWVPYSAEQMYSLVCDIEQYSEFIPWCKSTEILSRSYNEVRATVYFSKGVFSKSFSTINTMTKNKSIELKLLNGPFSHLQGQWTFTELSDESSEISLVLDFEVANQMLALALGPIFKQMTSSMVSSFQQRASEIYTSVECK